MLALACAALASCDNSAATRGRLAHIALQPRFTQRDAQIYGSLPLFNLGVTTLHVVLKRPNSTEVVKDTTVTLADGQDEVVIVISIAINGTEEAFSAAMELFSGPTLLFSGTQIVVAKTTVSLDTPPVIVPLWVGPGKNAVKIVISPRDITIPATGGKVTFSATAYDANNQPVTDPDFVGRFKWNVGDATLGSIPSAGGDFTPAGKTGATVVTVFTPNLLRDTVKVTLVTQLPFASLSFDRHTEVIDKGASSTVPFTTKDAQGNVITGAVPTYSTRNSAIATVSSSGAIGGVAAGQTIIVGQVTNAGTSAVLSDSVLAVIANPGSPVLVSSIDKFEFGTNTDLVVSVFVDMRSSSKKLGSTAIDVTWNPSTLTFQSVANSATSGVVPTVNTTLASTGKLKLAMADVNGFSGKVELLKITFKTSTSPSTGQLALTASEMTASDLSTDLLAGLIQVTHPLSIH